jgi:hypothetical protein
MLLITLGGHLMAEDFGFAFRNRALAVAAVVLIGLVALPACAELFVYEPFDYPAGEQLIGKSGGTGFTGPWRNETVANSATIQAGSLSFPGVPTSGNSVLMTGANGGNLEIFRNFNNIEGADGTTTWISFIGQRTGPVQNPPANPNNPYPRGVNISFYNTEGFAAHGREQFAIGNSSGAATNDWAFIGHGQVANILPSMNPPVTYGGGPPAFVVVRIDHHGPPNMDGTGLNDDVYFFVNPNPMVEPLTTNANAQRLGTVPMVAFDYSGLDYFRPFIGNQSGASPHGELLWDELRIGSTYADVTGNMVIPILPGDTDGDGIPGEYPDDFEPIRMNFRQPVTLRSQGDLVSNGVVDLDDFRQWKTAFLAGGGALAEVDLSLFSNVPEPATLVTVLAAAAILFMAPRRRPQ